MRPRIASRRAGSSSSCSSARRQLSGHVLDVGLGGPQGRDEVRDALVGRELGHGSSEQVARPQHVVTTETAVRLGSVRARQRLPRRDEASAERADLGEPRLLGGEPAFLVRILYRRLGDLVELESEQVDGTGESAGVSAELLEAGVDGGELASRLGHGSEVGPREAVQGVALRGLAQQGLMHVLAVEVDELVPDLRQHRHWCHTTVHIGARASRGGNGTGKDHLFVADQEPPLHGRFRGARSHHGALRPAAQEQLEGLDDEGLAGAGLTGERRHAGADHEVEIRDDP